MPRLSSLFFNDNEWDKLNKKVEEEGYPSKYAYVKDLVLNDLDKEEREDLLEYLCDRLGLGRDDLMRQAWKEFCENHGLLKG